jgi:hypothetical protein
MELGDWRGEMLSRLRALIKQADPEVVEEWKWRGVPVWSHAGMICTGAHEFGHLAGLDHRKGDRHALMRCGGVSNASVRVNRYECRCLLDWKSPQACKLSPDPICMSAAGN